MAQLQSYLLPEEFTTHKEKMIITFTKKAGIISLLLFREGASGYVLSWDPGWSPTLSFLLHSLLFVEL